MLLQSMLQLVLQLLLQRKLLLLLHCRVSRQISSALQRRGLTIRVGIIEISIGGFVLLLLLLLLLLQGGRRVGCSSRGMKCC